jgi:glycosyltransferase involved in cell wall biosynthesis
MDGASSDNSAEIIKKYEAKISYWESVPDLGLYHALQKGFDRSTGQIMGWINSDDLLLSNSLFTIAEIFSLSEEIRWVQGYPTVTDDFDRLVYHRPAVSNPAHFLNKGYHDGRFIQQESTFWRKDLWEQAGARMATELKYAGDFELWMRFFQCAPMYLTTAMIGSFRTRSHGQLSKVHYQQYMEECDKVIDQLLADQVTFPSGKPGNITYNFLKNSFVLG